MFLPFFDEKGMEYGSFEVFLADEALCLQWNEEAGLPNEQGLYTPGYYWWACHPGCMPDDDPVGPFKTVEAAIEDARR